MEGELKPLKSNAYEPSYDVSLLGTYDFERLDLIKMEIESDLHVLAKKLEANAVTMDSPLVTLDGFPRADINVIDIRTARVKIIKLRNDLHAVIDELSKKLSLMLQYTSAKESTTRPLAGEGNSMVAFALVTEIISQGPAEKSGLQVNDKIVSFNGINAANHNNLRNISQLVKANEDGTIVIGIMRDGARMDVSLTPTSNWPGQGLLGCRLTQI